MKFFTLDVYNSWYSTYENASILEAAFQHYYQYLDDSEGILPTSLLTLARLPGVGDGLVVQVKHDKKEGVLVLTLRCGDLQMGYYDLVLVYEAADISFQDEQTLARIARSTKDHSQHESDLYFHELEALPDGRIEHRLLFHPGIWFVIRCHTLHWAKADRPDRKLPVLKERFSAGPAKLTKFLDVVQN